MKHPFGLRKDKHLSCIDAVAQNVIIATPTTLILALRTAASVWQDERHNKNAEAIATRAGGQLYDKFVGFTEDMRSLDKRLEQAQSTYGEAMGKPWASHGQAHHRQRKSAASG